MEELKFEGLRPLDGTRLRSLSIPNRAGRRLSDLISGTLGSRAIFNIRANGNDIDIITDEVISDSNAEEIKTIIRTFIHDPNFIEE